MKPIIFAFLWIPSYILGQETWINFVPDENLFEIQVPGKMEWGVKHVLTALGEMKTTTYLYKGPEENPDPVYIINYTPYPPQTLDKDSIEFMEMFFQTSLEGIMESLEGKLIYAADISNVYTPQKLYKIHYNNGLASVKGKMIVEKDIFYSIQVFSSFQKSQEPEIDKFLESFRIIE